MTWFDETLRVRERAQMEREALAASVEELGSQHLFGIDSWDEEDIPPVPDEPFPPLHLRLQSRPSGGSGLTGSIPAFPNPPATSPVSTPRVTSQGQRLAGRSTRVRLQAVRPETAPMAELSTDQRLPAMEPSGPAHHAPAGSRPDAASQEQEKPSTSAPGNRPWPRLPGGRGLIRAGQGAVTVPNASITERSVVNVMLAGNPGPAVVHYILLHPHMGFTIHLTSPATASAPFHYIIWPF
jgi:hypothetical protein